MHGFQFGDFVTPIEQTARFCGMSWEAPVVLHGAHKLSEAELSEAGQSYRRRLQALLAEAASSP